MSGSIEGQVLDQRDGQGIAGADLEVEGEGVEKQAESGKDGFYAFTGLAAGTYELTASKAGFDDGSTGRSSSSTATPPRSSSR